MNVDIKSLTPQIVAGVISGLIVTGVIWWVTKEKPKAGQYK